MNISWLQHWVTKNSCKFEVFSIPQWRAINMHLVSTTRKQGFFISKISQKVPQMPLVQLDQGAILDKSFSAWPLWLGFFCGLFGLNYSTIYTNYILNNYNNIIVYNSIYNYLLNILINKSSYLHYLIFNVQNKIK
jgi:hypothetical protein